MCVVKRGLRERKKVEQRQRIADVAAALFAERGYDAVSISDVAEAAHTSYQTVYNYFPARPDLALDRAAAVREQYGRLVRQRAENTSPASALRPMLQLEIDRFRWCDPDVARGQHPALCVRSLVFRGFALLSRERDAETIAEVIVETCPAIHPLVARVHAAALVAVVQAVIDGVGRKVLVDDDSDAAAEEMEQDACAALDDLDRQFMAAQDTALIVGPFSPPPRPHRFE